MVIHADNLTSFNFSELVKAHFERPNDCVGTMLTFITQEPESCGIVDVDKSGRLTKIHEKVCDPPGNRANGACYIFSKEAIREIVELPQDATCIVKDYIQDTASRFFAYTLTNSLSI